jgi:hypothetical protein
MSADGERLQAVLEGYAKLLREKDLELPKRQPYLARWVRKFLHFARARDGCTFEQTLDLFLAEVGGRVGIRPWQIQQAEDAHEREKESAVAGRLDTEELSADCRGAA